ncbi:hypothetical protein HYW42_02320 [Candidatus Daviesbacteria bacterium]|nr:hypothetical protein [Candidatus Daviesbacteria bacterium]
MYPQIRYFLFIFVLILLFVTGQAYKNVIFSTKFVDEEYNFAIGKYLAKGEILYDDIITNHQPVTHILSGLLQKKENPDTTYALIKSQRTAIINWSAIWSIILVFYFGLAGLIFVFIYELTKIHFYGNLFLAETIVVYPLVFLIGLSIFRKIPLRAFELFFSGSLIAFLTLTLGPIYPAIFFLTLLFLINSKKSLIFGLSGAFAFFLLVLPFINIPGFFQHYFFGNLENMVPQTKEYWISAITQSFASPILSFQDSSPNDNLKLIRILSITLILNLVYFLFKRKFFLTVTIIILSGLLNLRFIRPGEGHAGGFHLLPWYASLVFITSVLLLHNTEQSFGLRTQDRRLTARLQLGNKNFRLRYLAALLQGSSFVKQIKSNSSLFFKGLNILLFVIALNLSFSYAKQNLFIQKDAKKDFEVFFSNHTKIGESIKNLKKPGDTLFVFPDAWLVYWQSDIDHLPKLFGYYTWMSGIPKLQKQVNYAFINFPPTFYYCEGCEGVDLYKYLNKYTEAKGYEGKKNLYILPRENTN